MEWNRFERQLLGATDFIKKPFDMDDMRILINRTLEREALVNENKMLKQQLGSQANKNSLIGYYAEIELENNSTDKIELFSLGSEVTQSSK